MGTAKLLTLSLSPSSCLLKCTTSLLSLSPVDALNPASFHIQVYFPSGRPPARISSTRRHRRAHLRCFDFQEFVCSLPVVATKEPRQQEPRAHGVLLCSQVRTRSVRKKKKNTKKGVLMGRRGQGRGGNDTGKKRLEEGCQQCQGCRVEQHKRWGVDEEVPRTELAMR